MELQLTKIGVIHSPYKQATGTPIQPVAPGFRRAMRSCGGICGWPARLAGFERVWLIYYFHRASAARMSVVPYRDTVERGLVCHAGSSAAERHRHVLRAVAGCPAETFCGWPRWTFWTTRHCWTSSPRSAIGQLSGERCGWLDTVPDKPVVADDRFERKEHLTPS